MIEAIQSIILGLIQGLTEFLPVSSSAHLNLFPWIFGWSEISESFDVALHLGTLLAICVFFFKDWLNLLKGGFSVLKEKICKTKSKIDEKTILDGKIFWYIVIATIPAGILSLVLDKLSEMVVGGNLEIEMGLIGFSLIVMGVILYLVEKRSKSEITYEKLSLKDSILIGASQAIAAAFPGVSRSGITMTVARALKIDREGAAKFSFLLSAPIVAAAVVFDITNFTLSVPFFIGILTSFISGVLVIKFLMEYLKKGSFKVFAIYRIILGLIVFGIILFR
jgi:undecaprenyl-diphosphatase